MTLSALIKKGGLTSAMTATPATPATQEEVKLVTVAPVATVAVAESPKTLSSRRVRPGCGNLKLVGRVAVDPPEITRELTDDEVNRLIVEACEGLSIRPAHLYSELVADGDIPSIRSGELAPKGLRIVAETLALMRQEG